MNVQRNTLAVLVDNESGVLSRVARLFSGDGSPDYARTQALLDRSVPGSHGVFALPYLVGERFPVLDPDVRGMFVGLTPETAQTLPSRVSLRVASMFSAK